MDDLPASPNRDASGLSNLKSQVNLAGGSRRFQIFLSSFVIIIIVVFFLMNFENVKPAAGLKPLDVNRPEIVKQNLQELSALTIKGREAVDQSFDRDLEITATESGDIKKSSPYIGLYSSLRARYNVTKNPDILKQMRDIEQLIQKEWPRIYKSLQEGGTFLR